jgi:hypothetical protein
MMSETMAQISSYEETKVRSQQGGWGLWWRWVLATTVGELLGFAAPATIAPLAAWVMTGILGTVPDSAMLVVAVLAGVVEGGVLGLAQWLVLLRYIQSMAWREWVMVTALAAGVAYILGMTPGMLADSIGISPAVLIAIWIILGVLLVCSIGFAQWLVLRRYVQKAGWWVLANAVAWPLGLAVPFIALTAIPDASPVAVWVLVGIASGVLMGAVVGAITGIALVWLLRPRSP